MCILEVSGMNYTLIRSDRRTLNMKITSEGEIVVRAPKRCAAKYIDSFVMSHAEWIRRNQAVMIQRKEARKNTTLQNGEMLRLCGMPLSIQIIPHALAAIQDGNLILPSGKIDLVREDIIDLMKKHGQPLVRERLIHWSRAMRIPYSSMKISTARHRWGSCNRNHIIRISVFLLLAPVDIIDYVLVHELAHCRYFNHGTEFWALVESAVPDWKDKKLQLREYQYNPLIQSLTVKEE